jgi:two-component system nitrogen regulation sensor histidine kinase GlnL
MILNTSHYTTLLEQLTLSVVLVDSEFKLHYANASASELFGISAKRILATSFNQLFHHHSIDLNKISENTFIQGNDCLQHRANVVFNDGRHATIRVAARRVIIDTQTYMLIECRSLNQELKHDQASNQMHQQSAARNLIRGLAHEIKNPLGGIRGAAQLLQFESDQQEREQCANLIIEQTDRLTELVDRLLGPNQLPNKEWVNIHQTLGSVIQLSMLENQQAITLKKDYDPSIPDVFIDNGKIQQVLLNITRNALHALNNLDRPGTLTLKTRIKHHTRLHNKAFKNVLLIQVIDNGNGIDESLKETLFFPMVTNKDGGSGLGLAIAQTLIGQHQGFIECDSWPGHTEFNIYLPLSTETVK